MRADELAELERTFGLTLPPPYRATLLAYPFAPGSHAAESALPDDAAFLREQNAELRAIHPAWPATTFFIGSDGGECQYVLDVARSPAVVQVLDLEAGAVRDETTDWDAWLAQLDAEERELAAQRDAHNAAYQRRRWWQFWMRPWP